MYITFPFLYRHPSKLSYVCIKRRHLCQLSYLVQSKEDNREDESISERKEQKVETTQEERTRMLFICETLLLVYFSDEIKKNGLEAMKMSFKCFLCLRLGVNVIPEFKIYHAIAECRNKIKVVFFWKKY